MRLLVPALAAIVATVVLGISGCGASQAHGGGHQMPPPQVGVSSPIARQLAPVKDMTGSIEAIEVVELKPRVSGVVVKVHVADGVEVKAGDPILDIDDLPLKAAVARSSAQVASAEAHLALARLQLERGKRLVQDQVISRQLYDDQEAGVRTAEADLAAAKAAALTADLDLGYARVTAPISGRLSKVMTTTGNLVQGGGPVPATLLTTLVSVDPVYVSFDVDEGTWQQIGGRLRAAAGGGDALPVTVALMGEQGFPHAGTVVFVDNRIDGGSGAIRVRARLPNPDRRLTPGAFARVRLETGPARPVVLVHERAVLSQLNTRYVLGVDDKGVTSFRPVQLGAHVGDLRVVEQGLTPQDRIVVVGLAKVFYPGMPVSPLEASMETLEVAAAPAAAPAGAPGAQAAPEAKPVAGAPPAAKPDAAKPAQGEPATTATKEGAKP